MEALFFSWLEIKGGYWDTLEFIIPHTNQSSAWMMMCKLVSG